MRVRITLNISVKVERGFLGTSAGSVLVVWRTEPINGNDEFFSTSLVDLTVLFNNSITITITDGINNPNIKNIIVVFDFLSEFVICTILALSKIILSGEFEAFRISDSALF